MSYYNYTPARNVNNEEFRPSARRWEGMYQEDTLVTYYSNTRIFSHRTERDDTIEMGELYTDIEDDD